jgi:hypothetical protein
MKEPASRSGRRTGVVLNYFSLTLLALALMASEYGWGTGWPIVGIVAGLLLFILTFIQVYGRTGLWRFVHLKLERLDEREVQLIHRALRLSYAAFTVMALLYILILNLGFDFFSDLRDPEGDFTLGNVIFAVFIYLSHILPASVIAWNERSVLI